MPNYFRLFVVATVCGVAYFFLYDPKSLDRYRRSAINILPTYCATQGHIALTFDEGPGPLTPDVLNALSTSKVQATFHVVTAYLSTVATVTNIQTAFNQGHLIGLRFPTQLNPSTMTDQAFTSTLLSESTKLFGVIQKYPKYLRLPSGQYDNHHIGLANSLGFVVTGWTIDSNDYSLDAATGGPQLIQAFADQIVQVPAGKGRYIALLHDLSAVYGNQTNIVELNKYINQTQYTAVTLDKCVGSEQYRPSNGVQNNGPPSNNGGSQPGTGDGTFGGDSVKSGATSLLMLTWASMLAVAVMALMF